VAHPGLRLAPDTPDDALRPELITALRRWQHREASPFADTGNPTHRGGGCAGPVEGLPRRYPRERRPADARGPVTDLSLQVEQCACVLGGR